MSNEMNAKVRMVRCPKCLHLLPEPADIPLYKCGGCGTILQAKRMKNESMDPQPSCAPVNLEQPQSSAEEETTNGPRQESSLSPDNRDETSKGETGTERVEGLSPFCPSETTHEHESPESAEISRGLDRSFYDCYDGSASSCDGDGEILNVDKAPFFTNGHRSPSTYRKSDFRPPRSVIMGPGPDRTELEDQIRKMRLQERAASANRDPFRMNTMKSRGCASAYRKSGFGPDPAGPDRIELLRKMIHELEDQIDKIRRGNGNCPHTAFHSRQSQMPKMPFSGEVQRCSAHLPGGCIYCNAPCSSSPGPGRSSLSRLERFHLREKYAKKRHLLPVGSGAPIIACHYCSELLKIPAEFGLFGRRYHRLRCHACKNILRFSVRNGKHVVPCFKVMVVAPPPSEDDDISNGTPENVGRESSSPLHRLMGYSSVSQVMKQ